MPKQLELFDKARKVILSCKTRRQLAVAKKFFKLCERDILLDYVYWEHLVDLLSEQRKVLPYQHQV